MTVSLSTARLQLEPLAPADVDAFHALSIEPGVRRYLWDDQLIDHVQARLVVETSQRLWEEKAYGLFGVRETGRPPLVGYAGLWDMPGHAPGELLYALGTAWWGRGLATEAAIAVLDDAVTRLGLREIVASTDVPNAASVRVLRRLGMQFFKREIVAGLDTVFYRISADAISRT